MPDSDWSSKFTLGRVGGAIFALWLVISVPSCIAYHYQHGDQRADAREYYKANSAKEGDTLCVEISRPRTKVCKTAPPDSDPNAYYTHYDLRAQQDMAELAYAMLIATGAGLIITAFGLVYIIRTFRLNAEATKFANDAANAATEQAKSAQEALDVTRNLERPFCLFEIVQQSEPPKSSGETIAEFVEKVRPDRVHVPRAATEFIIHNYGRTPAIIISYRANKIERWNTQGEPDPIDHQVATATALPHGFAIRAASASEHLETLETIEADPEMMRGQKDVKRWFYIGFVIYRDVMGHYFVAGFGYYYEATTGRWKLLRSKRAHDAFNYDYRIDPVTYALEDDRSEGE